MSTTSALLTAQSEPAHDVRPVVATGSSSRWGVWAFALIMLAGGLWIFSLMSAARTAPSGPLQQADDARSARIESPAPLVLPPHLQPVPGSPTPDYREMSLAERARLYPASPVQVRPVVVAGPVVSPRSAPAVAPPASSSFPAADARNYTVPPPPVWETPRLAGPAEITAAQPAGDPEAQATRVRAARLANPAFTVPQGTVIPAVLETGIDSTRPGSVRALVQRDVTGFDGSQVLIHRGSRLIGEYDAGLQQGERRALVRWTRLVRPDGVTIALDSPASDPLGRAGIEGEVDSRFLQRFGNALLQSILDVGTGLAVRRATDGVIVALPGSTQNVQRSPDNQIRPTLRVRHGTSVSVFVARDLDFSGF